MENNVPGCVWERSLELGVRFCPSFPLWRHSSRDTAGFWQHCIDLINVHRLFPPKQLFSTMQDIHSAIHQMTPHHNICYRDSTWTAIFRIVHYYFRSKFHNLVWIRVVELTMSQLKELAAGLMPIPANGRQWFQWPWAWCKMQWHTSLVVKPS